MAVCVHLIAHTGFTSPAIVVSIYYATIKATMLQHNWNLDEFCNQQMDTFLRGKKNCSADQSKN